MIPKSRFGPVFEAAPGRVIAIFEIFRAPVFVGQVACGKNRPGDLLDQLGCRPGSFRILTTSNIAGTDQNKSALRQTLLLCFDSGVLGSIDWRRL